MTAIATLPLAFSGLALLSLSMDRHVRQAAMRRRGARRPAGWLLLALSLAAALASDNWRFGLVEWTGIIAAAAALVVLVLVYRPRALLGAAVAGTVLGVAGWAYACLR